MYYRANGGVCFHKTHPRKKKEERRRHIERNDSQNDTWLQGRRSQIDNIQKNFNLYGQLNIVANNDIETSLNIQDEIYGKII